ncbi:MAG: copper amine oxidase N-terminal domain-containing protein [Peptococcaceae bacterium]|nr:copper amine oxidase N-terminal domain-containing protein [Peptococcaceae bacterium]
MSKIRNKRISLLLAIVFALTLVLPMGSAFAADYMKVTKAVKENVPEDQATDLGWFKITIENEDAVDGWIYLDVQLPDGVEFTDEETSRSDNDQVDTSTLGTDDYTYTFNFTGSNQVTVEDSAADDIEVEVTAKYVDTYGNLIDKFEGSVLVGTKGDAEVSVTADDPKSVTMGEGKAIAEITLEENFAGALEQGSVVVFTLPDGFKWDDPVNDGTSDDWVDAGTYGLDGDLYRNDDNDVTVAGNTISFADYDDEDLILVVTNASSPLADKLTINAKITVYPDADEGDVTVEVVDDSPSGIDSNIDDTELTVAIYGESDVTVTADEDTGDEYIYLATEDNTLWDITLETSGSFTDGDDLILELPKGVEFMESMGGATFSGFTNKGLFNSNRSLWLQINSPSDPDEITISGLEVGVKPDAEVGDLVVELSGDVCEGSVVASEIKSRVTVSAEKANVVVGLEQLAGDITLVETEEDALSDNDVIYLSLPSGVSFASAPTVYVNDEEVEDAADIEPSGYDEEDGVCEINVGDLKSNKVDTIVITDIKYNIDSRFADGEEVVVSIGGEAIADDLNQLDGATGAQFEDEADDAVVEVVNAVVGAANKARVSFTVGDEGVYVQNGRTLVQVNLLCDELGLVKTWDSATQTAYFVQAGKVVAFPIGEKAVYISGIKVPVDQGAEIINGSTCVPVRYIQMAFGGDLSWDGDTQTATFVFNK